MIVTIWYGFLVMLKTIFYGFIALTLLLLSGCWWLSLPSDQPEAFTSRTKEIKSLSGSTSVEVQDLFGPPHRIVHEDNAIYYIYEWRSKDRVMMWMGYWPTPLIDSQQTGDIYELHCILLEFGEDDLLKSYKIDSVGADIAGSYKENCKEAFGIQGTAAPILTTAYYQSEYKDYLKKRAEHGDDPIAAWKLYMARGGKLEDLHLLCTAADEGVMNAQSELGWIYRIGKDVPRDIVRAYMWFKLASIKEDHAKNELTDLERLMTPLEINEANQLFSNWRPGQCERDLILNNTGN